MGKFQGFRGPEIRRELGPQIGRQHKNSYAMHWVPAASSPYTVVTLHHKLLNVRKRLT